MPSGPLMDSPDSELRSEPGPGPDGGDQILQHPTRTIARTKTPRITLALKDGNATARRTTLRSDLCHGCTIGAFGRLNMNPRFRSGQTVRFSARLMRQAMVTADYQIVKQLPDERGEQQYLVKSALEPYGRVAKESELQQA